MLVRSREVFVGFLLVLTLAACGQNSTQTNSKSVAMQPPVATVENTPAPTSIVTETVLSTPTTAPSTQESPTTAVTKTVVSNITMTDTRAVTESATLSLPSAMTATSPLTVPSTVTTSVEVTSSQVTTAATGTAAADPALLAAGLEAYHANYCGVCHTLDKAETRGTFGPPHNALAATVAVHLFDGTYQGAAKTPSEYVHESIVNPQAYIVPGYAATSHRMPSYAHLDDATLNALVAFLLAP